MKSEDRAALADMEEKACLRGRDTVDLAAIEIIRLQATCYVLQATCYRLRATGYRLQATGYRLRAIGYYRDLLGIVYRVRAACGLLCCGLLCCGLLCCGLLCCGLLIG